jgi:putative DNA primase/helicase
MQTTHVESNNPVPAETGMETNRSNKQPQAVEVNGNSSVPYRTTKHRASEPLTHVEISTYYRVRVPGLVQRNTEWRGPCPIHSGRRESFAVNPNTGAWFCHSDCNEGGSIFSLEEKLTGHADKDAARAVYETVGRTDKRAERRIVASYQYTDESGNLLFECVRYDPKDFKQRRPDGKGNWVWDLKGVRLVPYRLPEIVAADTVYVCEGEKDVATLEGLGLTATCNPMGASKGKSKWRFEYNQYFQGKHVIVIPDQDEVGVAHGKHVAGQLALVATSVRIVNLPSGKDVTDWTASGGTAEDLARLVGEAGAVQPPTVSSQVEVVTSTGIQEDFERLLPTDVGNADLFIKHFGSNLRYLPARGQWLLWNAEEGRWIFDDLLILNRLAMQFTRSMRQAAGHMADIEKSKKLFLHALNTDSRSRMDAMLHVARTFVAIRPDELDSDKFLLNCLNGTIDLRTGELRPHRKEDLITKQVAIKFDPDARSEEWEQFLRTVMEHDHEVISFLQRAIGYTLTGDNREEVLFFMHGKSGKNGKSTFRDAIKTILGDYARVASFGSFQETSFSSGGRTASPDIARLAGARFVSASEANAGVRLDIALIKTITGRDPLTARFLRQENFEFYPEFKLWLLANDPPMIDDEDDAAWRRVIRIPFNHTVENPDTTLKDRLANPLVAGPAILAWAVRGCLDWQHGGLRVPEAIQAAVKEYRAGMDPLEDFYDSCCVFGDKEKVSVKSSSFHSAYTIWARSRGIKDKEILTQKALTMRLVKWRGCETGQNNADGRVLRGVGLVTQEAEPAGTGKFSF